MVTPPPTELALMAQCGEIWPEPAFPACRAAFAGSKGRNS